MHLIVLYIHPIELHNLAKKKKNIRVVLNKVQKPLFDTYSPIIWDQEFFKKLLCEFWDLTSTGIYQIDSIIHISWLLYLIGLSRPICICKICNHSDNHLWILCWNKRGSFTLKVPTRTFLKIKFSRRPYSRPIESLV